ncbi:28S ribosomal protein S9, mitochondrial [Hylaeus anthracinus]|uniref:28S ribosomal protein S9, mitochondrial n=1 Tax=Hylaeus anthracinus TaxID=313031 RepID=UPI0023BA23CC|nr:28S ribosomal protein S9, mitochondrial [Hylaeus anthracinus]
MALTMFTRSVNIRNVMKLNNISAVGGTLNVKQHLNVSHKSYTVSAENINQILGDTSGKKSEKGMNKVMRLYLQRSREYQEFVEKEIVKYDLGKRHLANMMGEDPDQFSDDQITKSIEYLLPSGLYDWRARPMMVHPNKLFEKRKEAQFDESGRPFHFLFYTCKPNYYSILYDIADSIRYLNRIEDMKIATRGVPSNEDKFNAVGTDWFTKEELESNIMELLKTADMEYDSNDRPFVLIKNCKRKNAHGDVKVLGDGSGKFTINGQDLTYFKNVLHREQLLTVFDS